MYIVYPVVRAESLTVVHQENYWPGDRSIIQYILKDKRNSSEYEVHNKRTGYELGVDLA